MTVTNETARVVYTGNGTTDTYAVPFKIYETSDLVITQVTIATGAESVLVLDTDFTFTPDGAYPNTGSLTLTAGNLSSLYQLVVQRSLPYTQEADYTEADPFPAASHENALDKIVMMVQQIKDLVDRVILQDITATSSLSLPALTAGSFLGNDGSALLWQTPSAVTYSGTITFGTDASKDASPTAGDVHIASDTKKIYACLSAGVWTQLNGEGSIFTNLANIPSGAGRIPTANMPIRRLPTVVDLGNSGASTVAVDASLGDVFEIDATGNFTLGTPTNPPSSGETQYLVFRIKQDGTGSRTITLDSGYRVSNDLDGGTVTLTTTAGATDYMIAKYNADDSKWDVIGLQRDVS